MQDRLHRLSKKLRESHPIHRLLVFCMPDSVAHL
jgi:hypothetical protein